MPNIRSVQIGAGLVESGQYLDFYTVPEGVITLVKSWSVSPGDNADNTYRLYGRLQVGQTSWIDEIETSMGVVIHKGCWVVLESGDVLGIYAIQAAGAYHVNGAQLVE